MLSKRKTTPKILSVLLTLTLALSLFTAMPLTASAATGTLHIAGDDFDIDLSDSGPGWSWNAGNSILTLDGGYTGEHIYFECDSGNTVNLKYSGDVTIEENGEIGIECNGKLNISGSGGTLSIISDDDTGIKSADSVTVSGGKLDITATKYGISVTSGDVAISTNVTIAATGSTSDGIRANNIVISGGTVDVTATDNAVFGFNKVTVSGGSNHSFVSTAVNYSGICGGAGVTISGGSGICKGGGGSVVAQYSGTITATNVVVLGYDGSAYTVASAVGPRPGGGSNVVFLKAADTTEVLLNIKFAGSTNQQSVVGGGNSKQHHIWPISEKEVATVPQESQGPAPMKPNHVAGTEVYAVKTSNPLILDGEQVDFPAVKIDGWNWLKLRDLAMLLNGTSKQFSIGYDASTNTIIITTGGEYEPIGDELMDMLAGDFTAVASGQKIMWNGKLIEVAAYNIDGYNYFRLRDLMILLNVLVVYDPATGEVTLDLDKPYSE